MNVQDQTGKLLLAPPPPFRIISAVPSITELLFELGLEEEVIGITKFCVHPPQWFKSKIRIGGTKSLHIDAIKKLQPTLIFSNKEENVKEQVEQLETICPVYVSDIKTIEDAYEMILHTGILTGRTDKASLLVRKIKEAFATIQATTPLKALYLIWQNPLMAAGGDTFISHMMAAAGFVNVLQHQPRYPELTNDDIKALSLDVILLSSEPYPFQQKHAEALQKETDIKNCILADGEIFSWYGSRMLLAPAYFQQLRDQLL